jgi:TPR repeat protein
MVEQARQYRSGNSNLDAFDKNTAEYRGARGKLRRSAQTDLYLENSVPLFISDSDGEADPSEFSTLLLKKRRASISSRILAGVCATAAVAILVALFSSDAARDTVVNVRGSMAAVFPAPSVGANSDPSQLTSLDRQNDPARPAASINQTHGRSVTTAAAEPAREDLKVVYQSALQGGAPAADAVAEPATPADAIHHLDPEVIAALLRRADALIASGDVAAARLVLRRAADAGDAGAAMALAGTYDPANLAKLGVRGVVPDLAMARSWYEKARTFGSAEAPQRLEMLASKRQ